VKENNWDDKVRFFPRMPYKDMMAITRLAEIGFTLDKPNNLNYLFSLPNKLFDYIQANVPIIASHLTEIERIIRDYNIGTFIEEHNPEHIAQKIKEVLSDEETLKIWKNNLNTAAQDLCWENEEQTLIRIYEQYI
jgi:glycosyltransferase involved in cell wall biosynthesis